MKWPYSTYSKINPVAERNFALKKPRPGQVETVSEILEAISKGYKYIVLEAGTGTGKSAIAATLSNIMESSYILTVTKQLQDQYLNDFKHFRQVKGRGNFECASYANDGIHQSCDEGRCILEEYNCQYPQDFTCNYYNQKNTALEAKTVVSNYHYMFFELNYVEDFTKRELLICDEAHNLESVIMSQLKLEFTRKELKEYIKYDLTDDVIESLSAGDYNVWISFIDEIKSSYIRELEKIQNLNKPEVLEKISNLKKQINSFNHFTANLTYDPSSWVMDYDEEYELLTFKPVKVNNYATQTLLKYGDVCLFMSATILDYQLFAKWLGVKPSEIYAIRKRSPFNLNQNPIMTSDKYNLSKGLIKRNAPKTIPLIRDILKKHENEKGIIHTVSSQCMMHIMDNIQDSRLIAHNTKNRSEVLEEFKKSTDPLVLVSPSMDEGVDLPGDECRFQIIYKIPYPDLGDLQVKTRMETDRQWYDYKTALRLVQTHGRGMRYEDDYCKTYFIDSRLKKYVLTSKYTPDYFKNLVKSKKNEKLIREGIGLLEDGEYEKAVMFFNDLLRDDSYIDDYRVSLYLSMALHELALYEDELKIILSFLSQYPDDLKHFKKSLTCLDEMGYFSFC